MYTVGKLKGGMGIDDAEVICGNASIAFGRRRWHPSRWFYRIQCPEKETKQLICSGSMVHEFMMQPIPM